MVNDSIPSKYAKLEESFDGFINRSPIRFEYEKSPFHTIVYDGTGTGKTYFVRQYLKLHKAQDQDQIEDNKNKIIICKHDREFNTLSLILDLIHVTKI